MASPLSAAQIVAALRAEGCRVVEYRSWRTHNRNHKGPWGPVHGVMVHHTVTSGTQRTVDICYDGYSTLPGPLCLGVIAKDGTVYLVGNGRANHAGLGDDDVLRAVIAEKATPAPNENNADGNARFYGFECENEGDGEDPWPEAQLTAIERASAALCRAHGWGQRSVIGHKEWTDTKIDPRGFSMGGMRDRIGSRLAAAPDDTIPEPAPQEDDDMPIRTSLGKDLPQEARWGEWTQVKWDKEYADPEGSHASGNYPGYTAQVSTWADFNGRLVMAGLEPDDELQVRYEVHDWKDGKSTGKWTEIISDQYATPGSQFVSLPFSKGLREGQHIYVAVCPYAAGDPAGREAPTITDGRWAIRQDRS